MLLMLSFVTDALGVNRMVHTSSVTLYGNGFILIPPSAGERTRCPLPTRESIFFRRGEASTIQFYFFIAPAVSPEIICLWKNRNMMITGKADKLETAKR
jgi:hypothetical protein